MRFAPRLASTVLGCTASRASTFAGGGFSVQCLREQVIERPQVRHAVGDVSGVEGDALRLVRVECVFDLLRHFRLALADDGLEGDGVDIKHVGRLLDSEWGWACVSRLMAGGSYLKILSA